MRKLSFFLMISATLATVPAYAASPVTINNAANTAAAAVKAASTAPTSSDPALVVTLSPNGPLPSPKTVAPATASTSAEACHVYSAAPATVYSLSGYTGGGPTWIMVFNATSAPADGAVTPVAWAYLAAAGSWSIAYLAPAPFSAGVTVCASSTGPLTKTAFSTNNVFGGQVV